MATFYVENFGCRATQADGAAIERQFQEQGLERATEADDAEIVVLNTCTVTAAADQDARAAVRRLHRNNPEARIVVTGCYAQRAPDEIAALPGVTSVIGNSHKHRLAEIAMHGLQRSKGSNSVVPGAALDGSTASDLTVPDSTDPEMRGFIPLAHLTARKQVAGSVARSPIFVSDIFAHTELQAAPVFDASNERTRPNLKIQDGCDNRCSFCVIPYVRGQSRSLPLSEIIREVQSLISAGYRELVVSGINLGRWGRDLDAIDAHSPAPRFEELIRTILSETVLQKLRISSVEPMDWSDELIDLAATSPRIAKHAHVPLQSGSDAVLRRMHRKYRPWHYREKIDKIRSAMPTAAIGADVMTGFPGETEIEFEETRRLIEELPFTYLHVFTYSARPGTPAATMAGQVPVQIARERNRILRELAAEKKLAFMNSFVGKSVDTITLKVAASNYEGEYTEGLTDNYLPVRLKGNHPSNIWIRSQVEGIADGTLVAVAS